MVGPVLRIWTVRIVAAFRVDKEVPIEFSRGRHQGVNVAGFLGIHDLKLLRTEYDRTTVDLFVLAKTIIQAFSRPNDLRFVKFDVTIWRNGEDVNLVDCFLKTSNIDYDRLLRSVIVEDEARIEDWMTLVFLSLTFGWDAILALPTEREVAIFSHDSWIDFSSADMAASVKEIFW